MTTLDNKSLIQEVNGTRYLLMEVLLTRKGFKEKLELVLKFDGIYVGIKAVNGGLFDTTHLISTILIPEARVKEFSDTILKSQ